MAERTLDEIYRHCCLCKHFYYFSLSLDIQCWNSDIDLSGEGLNRMAWHKTKNIIYNCFMTIFALKTSFLGYHELHGIEHWDRYNRLTWLISIAFDSHWSQWQQYHQVHLCILSRGFPDFWHNVEVMQFFLAQLRTCYDIA